MIERLLHAGMDVARLNFSHGTHDEHARRIAMLRETARRLGRPLAILQDLQGPKIRTGELVDGKAVQLQPGARFIITTREMVGTAAMVSTTYEELPHDVRPGDRILLSDGLIELRVLETSADEVRTEVVFGGELREHQGINLPGVDVSAPALTEKDIEDLQFGLEQNVDYIALSFVRRTEDLRDI
jgi:pyruvate kinase